MTKAGYQSHQQVQFKNEDLSPGFFLKMTLYNSGWCRNSRVWSILVVLNDLAIRLY